MAGQVWATSADGGFLYSDNLSRFLRMVLLNTVRYRQFCDPEDFSDKGLNSGDKFYWNVYSKVATPGRKHDENEPGQTTKFTITQAEGQVFEYMNTIRYTGLLNDLSLHPIKALINKVLKIDATETFDREVHAEFDATPLTVTPASGTSTTAITVETTGTPTATNGVAMNTTHWKLILDAMKERNIPGYFDNGDYGVIARPSTFRGVKDGLETLKSYHWEGYQYVQNGEIGRYEGARAFEQTNVASEGWSGGLSDAAHFFGEDTVHEAVVIPEEMRGLIGRDGGRDRGIRWYAILGFKLVHSVAAQARIMKWASAA